MEVLMVQSECRSGCGIYAMGENCSENIISENIIRNVADCAIFANRSVGAVLNNHVTSFKETINQAVSSQYSILSNPNTRSARYSNSTNSGFTAEVGFEILNGSCMADSVRIAVRPDSTGDNKWYAAFKSTDGSKTSKQNEVWEMDVLYHIDYVKP